MPGKKTVLITLSAKQEKLLEGFSRGTHTPLSLKQRSSVVLMVSYGESNHEISQKLQFSYPCVAKWRPRYATQSVLEKIEEESPLKLRGELISTLSDAPRPGTPPHFHLGTSGRYPGPCL